MSTINQVSKKKRSFKERRSTSPALKGCPQKKGICSKVYIENPKKPNSAMRKCCKLLLTSTKQYVRAYIPGMGHNIQEHSLLLVQGGRIPDLLGMRLKVMRGCLDALPVNDRKKGRSKYGVKKV